MINKIVDNLRKRVSRADQTDLASYRSLMWYYSEVKQIRTTNNRAKSSPIPEPGRMFLMEYSPKTAQDLEYYDAYPLIFIIDFTKDGFLGLNLHYLPRMERSQLLAALMNLGKNKAEDKIRLSYQLIKSFSRSKHAAVCIKRYISANIGDMIPISSDSWITVSGLPVENFKKKNKDRVWSESIRKLNRKN